MGRLPGYYAPYPYYQAAVPYGNWPGYARPVAPQKPQADTLVQDKLNQLLRLASAQATQIQSLHEQMEARSIQPLADKPTSKASVKKAAFVGAAVMFALSSVAAIWGGAMGSPTHLGRLVYSTVWGGLFGAIIGHFCKK